MGLVCGTELAPMLMVMKENACSIDSWTASVAQKNKIYLAL